MSKNTDAFDRICGACDGINIQEITEDDIRGMADTWNKNGERVTEGEIMDALKGLAEYQSAA